MPRPRLLHPALRDFLRSWFYNLRVSILLVAAMAVVLGALVVVANIVFAIINATVNPALGVLTSVLLLTIAIATYGTIVENL